ncbi:MAG: hypothetical protein J7K95_03255, partial [Thermoplasmata archaeon]|nr:hypothetical protein [Thermoplasmata archaeon]
LFPNNTSFSYFFIFFHFSTKSILNLQKLNFFFIFIVSAARFSYKSEIFINIFLFSFLRRWKIICPYCGSKDVAKAGKRHNKYTTK